MTRTPEGYAQNVFINCPFDTHYKPLFDSIVFTVQLAGFTPRCALEASNAGQARLYKIIDIIGECRYGIHDISRTELSRSRLPRFNMPLELGLDLGCRHYGKAWRSDKRLLVMDRSLYRYQKFVSDIAGQDVVSHSNSIRQIIRHVRDWLSTESKIPTIPGGQHIYQRYSAFQKVQPHLCKAMKLDREQLTFGDLSAVIRVWLEEDDHNKN
ncbi:MAG TPA: hypothetical protein VLE27_10235 [Thermoanaerobaculia bacterium]|nr:hypothetical protein [Thermoanaerobaculia bacterium]